MKDERSAPRVELRDHELQALETCVDACGDTGMPGKNFATETEGAERAEAMVSPGGREGIRGIPTFHDAVVSRVDRLCAEFEASCDDPKYELDLRREMRLVPIPARRDEAALVVEEAGHGTFCQCDGNQPQAEEGAEGGAMSVDGDDGPPQDAEGESADGEPTAAQGVDEPERKAKGRRW